MVRKLDIVSLSSGILGEPFVKFEVDIGLTRLHEFGLETRFLAHTMSGLNFIKDNPQMRAVDLLNAFSDDSDMILCAIGGDDTFRLLPYLFENDELKNALSPKIFLGFSDSTMNHLMLHKLGLPSFYGQAFLPDVCELEPDMLPYSKRFFTELITTGRISEIRPSPVWYKERTEYSEAAVGSCRQKTDDTGFKLLQGKSSFSGPILGGCIDTIYDIFDNTRYSDSVEICSRYDIFPSLDDWAGKILLLETSQEQVTPEKYGKMLRALKHTGIFGVINGILIGKPMDMVYAEEYHETLVRIVNRPDLPILCNINVGHATPRCIIPFGVPATVDEDQQVISFHYEDIAQRI